MRRMRPNPIIVGAIAATLVYLFVVLVAQPTYFGPQPSLLVQLFGPLVGGVLLIVGWLWIYRIHRDSQ